ncbi:MAG: hypothetical protein KDA60_20615, partial [Planctomycetales bacterium]|nr:hypothetical protein [Planctomycetales bacterium]
HATEWKTSAGVVVRRLPFSVSDVSIAPSALLNCTSAARWGDFARNGGPQLPAASAEVMRARFQKAGHTTTVDGHVHHTGTLPGDGTTELTDAVLPLWLYPERTATQQYGTTVETVKGQAALHYRLEHLPDGATGFVFWNGLNGEPGHILNFDNRNGEVWYTDFQLGLEASQLVGLYPTTPRELSYVETTQFHTERWRAIVERVGHDTALEWYALGQIDNGWDGVRFATQSDPAQGPPAAGEGLLGSSQRAAVDREQALHLRELAPLIRRDEWTSSAGEILRLRIAELECGRDGVGVKYEVSSPHGSSGSSQLVWNELDHELIFPDSFRRDTPPRLRRDGTGVDEALPTALAVILCQLDDLNVDFSQVRRFRNKEVVNAESVLELALADAQGSRDPADGIFVVRSVAHYLRLVGLEVRGTEYLRASRIRQKLSNFYANWQTTNPDRAKNPLDPVYQLHKQAVALGITHVVTHFDVVTRVRDNAQP